MHIFAPFKWNAKTPKKVIPTTLVGFSQRWSHMLQCQIFSVLWFPRAFCTSSTNRSRKVFYDVWGFVAASRGEVRSNAGQEIRLTSAYKRQQARTSRPHAQDKLRFVYWSAVVSKDSLPSGYRMCGPTWRKLIELGLKTTRSRDLRTYRRQQRC